MSLKIPNTARLFLETTSKSKVINNFSLQVLKELLGIWDFQSKNSKILNNLKLLGLPFYILAHLSVSYSTIAQAR